MMLTAMMENENKSFLQYFKLFLEIMVANHAILTSRSKEQHQNGMLCSAVVQWLSLLHNFIQLSLNSGSAQVKTLLVACQRFAVVRISDNGPDWKIRLNAFRRSTITQKTIHHHHHRHHHVSKTFVFVLHYIT